ncbi:MAG: ABC transporter permease [Acholeplasmataceae bacterium]
MDIKTTIKNQKPFFKSSVIITFVLMMPFVFAISMFFGDAPKWSFIVSNLLTTYVTNTMTLVLSVSVLSMMIGLYAAYMIESMSFKGKKILSLLLYLPLAIPAYVLSYIYVDTLSYSGRLHQILLSLGLDFSGIVFSMPMAIFILSLSLFPYAYLSFKVYFKTRNTHHSDVARLLNIPFLKRLTRIHIPLMLPTFMSALLFITFETINDYGVTKYLNIKTLTVGMFDSWFQMNDLTSSFYLASIYVGLLLLVSTIYLFIFKRSIIDSSKSNVTSYIKKLTLKETMLYTTPLWLICIFSLFIPMVELILNSVQSVNLASILSTGQALIQTLMMTFISSTAIIFFALMIKNIQRLMHHKKGMSIFKLPLVGYAFPGVMVALIYYYFYTRLDQLLDPLYQILFQRGLIISLSSLVLMIAYVFKYFAVGYKQISTTYDIIGTQHTLAAYTLKKSKLKTLVFIDMPMIKKGLFAGFILSFIDIIKELPMTLLLRPFNVQTLSTLIFTSINNEDISKASFASVLLIILTSVLIILLQSFGRKNNVS